MYDKQSVAIHKNHPKRSNLEKMLFSPYKTSEITKNSPKNDHSIAICSIFLNMVYKSSESSCPGGLEYVWQRGVGGV